MTTPILIAGATGTTGGIAAKLLLENGLPVRALVRSDDERAQKLKTLGAEIVTADLLDFRAIRRAFVGIKRAYFVYPMRPGLTEATAIYAQAASEAGAEFIVNMSQRTARADARSNSALEHWLAERIFDHFGVPVVHLHPTIFDEWLLYMRKGISNGHYAVPFGTTGKFASVSGLDLGRVIAAILTHPEGHAGQTYELFGPEELPALQIAEIVGRTLGKSVQYTRVSGEQWIKNIRDADVEIPFLAQHINGVAQQQQDGEMAGTNNVIERITGRKPESVAEFVERNRSAWR
ncbi:NmrA family transcriptional regulator [Dyella monticola]|uniref:NmrA family transcriptional regulator n=1 Tax=Dyella monticola TaxID=1927958 RepID=A0A370WUS6_9GAMM|nr:NmrA family NAD(P)-binding protein [Dyella monticola]RDS79893.1 NmrA family transcriptional regulator [Dyella monticola]